MVDSAKHLPNGGIVSDLTNLFSLKTRRTKIFAYGFMFGFVACTAFLAFSPSASSSPWFNNFFTTASISNSTAPYRSQFSSFISYIFPNASLASPGGVGSRGNGVSADNQMGNVVGSQKDGFLGAKNRTEERIGLPVNGVSGKNQTETRVGSRENGVSKDNQMGKGVGSEKDGVLTGKNHSESGIGLRGSGFPARNQTEKRVGSKETGVLVKNQTEGGVGSKKGGVLEGKNEKETEKGVGSQEKGVLASKNQSERGVAANENGVSRNNQKEKNEVSVKNQTEKGVVSQKNGVLGKNQTVGGVAQVPKKSEQKDVMGAPRVSNFTASLMKRNGSTASSNGDGRKREEWINSMMGCDLFQGRWVKDESYPLYPEGSCPHIDEPFDCYHNGRPDRVYQKLRWQPDACNIPRLNATDMLERLRGKRLVFVGDSLNRNMWESLVCVLRNSVKDKSKVFEASGRREFRTVGSYSFLFKDYGCTVEFFRSPFLVQEWEMPSTNGTTKETLRLDIIERSSSKYKDAHVIVFNTGHWWTHEKTSKGKDYYQEGSHIYGELNVVEAFHKALNTWAKWVDTNVNPKKTLVFFRGYSASHFSGGRWNSGGQCDRETEPIKNEAYLASYPPKMGVLETVIKGMKTPVSYLNITRMTDYRKDAHPSIYRKQNLTEEEMRSPERYQDCSHWCLPGVPDSWNELLYAQLLIKQHQLLQ